jgi:hypothetical protein
MAEPEKSVPERPEEREAQKSEDDRRAQAAAVNRKRTLDDWEEKKKRWRSMGVPPALPAAGSSKKGGR